MQKKERIVGGMLKSEFTMKSDVLEKFMTRDFREVDSRKNELLQTSSNEDEACTIA